MDESRSLSVIIPTHNRSESILHLLSKIDSIGFPSGQLECIVVCDGCTDDTVNRLQQLQVSFAFQYLETPGRGASFARDAGARRASGTCLLFLDDDIDPDPGLFQEFLEQLKGPNDVGICALLLEEEGTYNWNRLFLGYWWETHFRQLQDPLHVFQCEDVTSGALFMHRSFYEYTGGFDIRFRCREDYEFGYRLLKAGARLKFCSGASAIHRDQVSDQRRLHLRKKQEGFWDVELVRKHPESWQRWSLRSIQAASGYHQWFLWLAFGAPDTGDRLMLRLLSLQHRMEKWNWRSAWHRVEGWQHRYHYARGLSAQFRTIRAFRNWIRELPTVIPDQEATVPSFDYQFFADRWMENRFSGSYKPKLLPEGVKRFFAHHYWKHFTGNHNSLPDKSIPVSIVVCTRNRTEWLEGCLDALEELDYPEKEIIVVDNAPADEQTWELCMNRNVRYLRENRPGLDRARNMGISAARFPIVAFTDDDARVDKDWLKQLVQAFQAPDVMAVTGLVVPWELETKAQRLFEFSYGGMGHGYKRVVFDGKKMSGRQKLWASGMGVGANMAFRKEWFLQGGLFDPALDVGTPSGGGGDIEMFHRIVAKGFTLVYEPTMLVWHIHRRSTEGLYRQIFFNGRSFFCYLATAYLNKSVSRNQIVAFFLRDWMFGWLLKNLIFHDGKISRRLLLQEIRGLSTAPLAFYKSRQFARLQEW